MKKINELLDVYQKQQKMKEAVGKKLEQPRGKPEADEVVEISDSEDEDNEDPKADLMEDFAHALSTKDFLAAGSILEEFLSHCENQSPVEDEEE